MADQNSNGPTGAPKQPTFANRRVEGAYGTSVSKPIGSWLVDQVSRGLTVFGGGRANTGAPPSGAVPLADPLMSSSTALVPLMGMQPVSSTGGMSGAGVPPPPPVGPPPGPGQNAWFGPGEPMLPTAPRRDVAGREFDYSANYNIGNTPRAFETYSFGMLRALADNYDLLRLLIETRKDQMETLTGTFLPKKLPGQSTRPPADARCEQLNAFFQSPDGRLPYNTWKRKWMEDLFVIDAPAVYVRRDLGGRVSRLEIIDGATLVPRIDVTGRPAEPPLPAYSQVLKGMPAIDYRSDELIYWPRNMRSGRLYGCSPVQQIVATCILGLKREAAKLSYYTTGNIPEALVSVPNDWKAEDIKAFQANFDARMQDPRKRFGRITFTPGGGAATFTRSEATLFGEFDEWLGRISCYAFSLPELPFVKAQNRATAQTADEAAISQGLAPLMVHWKSFKDHVVQHPAIFGYSDIEYVYNDKEDVEPAELIETHLPAMAVGLVSGDELRGQMGDPPIGLRHYVKGIGPLGFMFVDDMVKASEMGLTIQAAAPPAPPAIGPDGMPLPAAPGAPPAALPAPAGATGAQPASIAGPPQSKSPALDQHMATLPPELLAAIGLGPDGPAARKIHVTGQDEFSGDPMHRAVAHPQVLKTLRMAERMPPPKPGGKLKPGALKRRVPPPKTQESDNAARV